MNVNSLAYAGAASSAATRPGRPAEPVEPGMRQAMVDLGKALRADDAQAARGAYAEMIRQAPDGAEWHKDSAFAALGKALLTQDLPAARQAYGDMIRNGLAAIRPQPPGGPTMPAPPAVSASSTGGVAGSLVNVSA